MPSTSKRVTKAALLLAATALTASATPIMPPPPAATQTTASHTQQSTLTPAAASHAFHPGIFTGPASLGASCSTTVAADPNTKDDWDFCCLQEYGAPAVKPSNTYVEDGLVTLRCELRAEYSGALKGCFGEFAGVATDVVQCEAIASEAQEL